MDPPRELSHRYLIQREIGRGGMARVYLALDRQSGAVLAVKILRPELASVVNTARFQREIACLRVLQHPAILPLLDDGRDGEFLYYTMPFVEGETLRAHLTACGPMELPWVLAVVRALAEALDYAHAQNIMHRDIKPENVILRGDGALLCDFGVARAIVAASTEELLSSSGILVGTPSYMSPEVALQEPAVDGRCDIYALGCVTYEMLVGEPPFTSHSPLALIALHALQAPRPLRSVRPEISPELESAVHAALAKDPAARPATAAAYYRLLSGH